MIAWKLFICPETKYGIFLVIKIFSCKVTTVSQGKILFRLFGTPKTYKNKG